MPAIRVVYFDYGNVISRDQSAPLRSEMQAVSGLDAETFAFRYSRFRRPYDSGHITAEEYWRRILDDRNGRAGRERIEDLIDLDVRSWEEIDDEMIDLAGRLKDRGLTVGILSNMPAVMDRYLERNKEWYGIFHPKVISGYLKLLKPEPEIYAHAADMAGHRRGEILFIDDMEENIRGAAEAGFRVHRYSGPEPLLRCLRDELTED